MLQTRPSSSSGMLPQGQPQSQSYGGSQGQRNSFYGNSGPIGGQQAYRANSGPIQPYAFTSTPNYHASAPRQQNAASYRTASSPAVPTMQSFDAANGPGRSRYPASASMTNLSQGASAGYNTSGARDDSSLPAIGGRRHPTAPRPQSAHLIGAATAMATQVTLTQATPIRVSPERYRRPVPRTMDGAGAPPQPRLQSSAQPSGSGMANVSHLYTHDQRPNIARSRTPSANNSRPTSLYSATPVGSSDDFQTHRRQSSKEDEAKRLRRRSMPALDCNDFSKFATPQEPKKVEEPTKSRKTSDREAKTARVVTPANSAGNNDNGTHVKNGSAESLASNRSASHQSSVSFPTCVRERGADSGRNMNCPIIICGPF